MIELGKQYRTRNGREARIYAVDGGGIFTVHGAYKTKQDSWACQMWLEDGRCYRAETNDYDLVEASE